MANQGSWRIGNYRLPDFGITERIQQVISPSKSLSQQGGSNLFGPSNYAAPPTYQPPQSNYQPPYSTPGQTLGISTQSGGGQPRPSGGGGGGNPGNQGQGQINTVNANAQDQQAQADFEFEQALNIIGQQEGALRSEASVGEQSQRVAGEQAKTRAGQAQQSNLSALGTEETSAQNQANIGLRQARDLFRQTQQQNIAQLSGLGISSSSVNEALAERLGVETARRIGGITGSLEEVKINIGREKTRVNEVFQTKLQEISDNTDLAIQRVQAGLQQGLAQLAAERGRAATAKAQARTDIAVNARNMIQQIQLEAQQRAQSIQEAATRRSQALQEAEQFMLRPTDFGGLQQHVSNVASLPQVGGFRAVPTFNPQTVQGQGFIQPGISYEKEDDPLADPFAN